MIALPITCDHCHLPIEGEVPYHLEQNGKIQQFCCGGCLSVWQLIHDSGLGWYYQEREVIGYEKPNDFKSDQDFKHFDQGTLNQRYVKEISPGRVQSEFLIKNLHCGACVWLIEHHFQKKAGIEETSVHLGKQSVKITWNPEQLHISQILSGFYQIGYQATPYDKQSAQHHQKLFLHQNLTRLAIAGFCAGNVMMLSIPLYTGLLRESDSEFRILFEWISGFLSLPVIAFCARPFWQGAWAAIQRKQPNMDLLISTGLGITFLYSWAALIFFKTPPYFDSCVTITFFLLIGRILEQLSRNHVVALSEKLIAFFPDFATRCLPGGAIEKIPLATLQIGDTLLVAPGEAIAADGIILRGESEIDESLLTGESLWRAVKAPNPVWGGTINQLGSLTISVIATGTQSVLGKITERVQEAITKKPELQKLADRIAGYFVWSILWIALVAWGYWAWKLQSFSLAKPWLVASSTVIIACACALGLATPVAVLVGVGVALRQGLLVKGGNLLEVVTKVTDLVLDKTGTLTNGQMEVVSFHPVSSEVLPEWIRWLYLLELRVKHPIAEAIIRYLESHMETMEELPVSIQFIPGLGIEGSVGIHSFLVGHASFLEKKGVIIPPIPIANNRLSEVFVTEILVAMDGHYQATFVLQDSLRTGVIESLTRLKAQKIQLHLLSGDLPQNVDLVARQLGIERAFGKQLPDQKQAYVEQLQSKGRCVMMVGDGINDAAALRQANVGVAFRQGTDLSIESADVVLLASDFASLEMLFLFSKRVFRVIRQNLGLALGYNLITIPMAVTGQITPLFSALIMASSSIIVTLNALRLVRGEKF